MSDDNHESVIMNKSATWTDPEIQLREVMIRRVNLETDFEALLEGFLAATGVVPSGISYRSYKSRQTGKPAFEVKVTVEI